MKTSIPGLLTVCILLGGLIMTGCSNQAPTPQPADTADTSGFSVASGQDATPAVYGLWLKEEDTNKGTARELLTITEKSVRGH